MLPYGMVRYHGAPADLRNVPLGTMLHGLFYLPPDPKLSSVPVVTQPSLTRPAENHALLLEDEPSYCLREGKVWKLKDVTVKGGAEGLLVAHREPKVGGEGKEAERTLRLDATTRAPAPRILAASSPSAPCRLPPISKGLEHRESEGYLPSWSPRQSIALGYPSPAF